MPSFTSVSEPRTASNIPAAAWLLLAGCVLIAVGVEGVARVALDRSSRIQRRMVQEYLGARSIGAEADARTHVLVVGNSLLDEGIAFDQLQAALPDFDTRRFVVEQTFYYDWYYGLKRLYSEGARPDVVVVMLGVGHWVANSIRGDYSAQYLFNGSDVPRLARDMGMHPTAATSLYLASLSKFWGARAEMRNFIIGHTMPDFGRLMTFTMPIDRRRIVDAEVDDALGGRLERLKALLAEHGSRLVVVVPPMLNAEDGAAGLMQAADRIGIPVLRPVTSGAFGQELYRDAGFHLNPRGAATFTERLIPALRVELEAVDERRTAATRLPGHDGGAAHSGAPAR